MPRTLLALQRNDRDLTKAIEACVCDFIDYEHVEKQVYILLLHSLAESRACLRVWAWAYRARTHARTHTTFHAKQPHSCIQDEADDSAKEDADLPHALPSADAPALEPLKDDHENKQLPLKGGPPSKAERTVIIHTHMHTYIYTYKYIHTSIYTRACTRTCMRSLAPPLPPVHKPHGLCVEPAMARMLAALGGLDSSGVA